MQTVAATLIVISLVGLALYFGWQQRQSLRWLGEQTDLSSEDRNYYRRQAWRRLVNSGLMLVLAILVAVYYLGGMEARVSALADLAQARHDRAEAPNFDAQQAELARTFAAFCFAVLVLLLAIVLLVAVDVWAIRRYGRRHLRQIQAHRRAMLESQIARMRSERNGHG